MNISPRIKSKIIKIAPFVSILTRLWKEGSVVTILHGVGKGLLWKRRHSQVNGYWKGTYEEGVQYALSKILKKGDVLYDIGANSGFHTLLGANLVGSEGTVVAAEPFPEFIKEIEEVAALNNIENIKICSSAISNARGDGNFSMNLGSKQTLIPNIESSSKHFFHVNMILLDDMLDLFPQPDVILMDIECFEGKVLEVASCTLETARPIFLIETHHREIEEGVINANQVRKALLGNDYLILTTELKPVEPQELIENHVLPNHIVAIPVEKSEKYIPEYERVNA